MLEMIFKGFIMEVKGINFLVLMSMLIQQINGKICPSCYKNNNCILQKQMVQRNCTVALNPVDICYALNMCVCMCVCACVFVCVCVC